MKVKGFIPQVLVMTGPGESMRDAGGVYLDEDQAKNEAKVKAVELYGPGADDEDAFFWGLREIDIIKGK